MRSENNQPTSRVWLRIKEVLIDGSELELPFSQMQQKGLLLSDNSRTKRTHISVKKTSKTKDIECLSGRTGSYSNKSKSSS